MKHLQCTTLPCRSRRTWPGVARHGEACLARQPRPAALQRCHAPPQAAQPPRGRCRSRTPCRLARPGGRPHRYACRAHASAASAATRSGQIWKPHSVLNGTSFSQDVTVGRACVRLLMSWQALDGRQEGQGDTVQGRPWMGLWLDGQRNDCELSSGLCNVSSTLVRRSVDVCLIVM